MHRVSFYSVCGKNEAVRGRFLRACLYVRPEGAEGDGKMQLPRRRWRVPSAWPTSSRERFQSYKCTARAVLLAHNFRNEPLCQYKHTLHTTYGYSTHAVSRMRFRTHTSHTCVVEPVSTMSYLALSQNRMLFTQNNL